jgi:penicillin-binding protein 2
LPGDKNARQIKTDPNLIDSWEGNLTSEDKLLKNQRDIAQLLPQRSLWNYRVLQVIVLLAGLVLLVRLWQLQVVKGAESLKEAEGNMIHVKTSYAPRGVIYDRNMQILAGNTSRYDLKVVPAMMPHDPVTRENNYLAVAKILGKEAAELRDQAQKDGLYNWNELILEKDVPRDQALLLKTGLYPGFFVEDVSLRHYYCDFQCAHVIGYTGIVSESELAADSDYQAIDQVGRSGLEKFYEKQLKGVNGAEYRIVDAAGETVSVLTPKKSVPGNSIVTSLDYNLQMQANENLAEVLQKPGITGGAIVITNPNTGEILALASAPTYSINDMTRGLTQDEYNQLLNDSKLPLFDRAISGEYPPGSTFKIVTGSAILSAGVAKKDDIANDMGVLRVVNKYDPSIIYMFYSWNHQGLGPVNIVDALRLSSDIYFYTYGGGYDKIEGLGIDRLTTYAEKFMISKSLGIDLEGERTGFIPSPAWKFETTGEQWYLGDDYNAAIGQGDILATPLQVNAYTSAIANGGKIYRPHLLEKVLDANNKEVLVFKNEIVSDNIIKSEDLATIREGLEQVVQNGTAKMLQGAPVSVAGKTGTAQYANNQKEHAWFTCYAPADNPQIAMTVLVEGGGEGSDTAVPIALNLINYYFGKK